MLTIAYISFRREPMIEWFWRSLERELCGDFSHVWVVVVDAFAERQALVTSHNGHAYTIARPKPNVWNGAFRLTKNEYFAAASTRNTALCHALDGYIAYVDDLSILMPGWLKAVRDAMKGNYIVCGAYRKVLKLEWNGGEHPTFENNPKGWDHRWSAGDTTRAVPCYPNWLFGCSVAGPVNAFLTINGWPEDADSTGLGGEDYLTGMALEATGHKLMYDRRMMTLESEERHFVGPSMLRVNKHEKDWDGKLDPDPRDKGHQLIERLRGCTRFSNDFTPFPDLAALRQHILSGGEFPVMKTPSNDWFDNQPLSQL
jgi:hypothetical protein